MATINGTSTRYITVVKGDDYSQTGCTFALAKESTDTWPTTISSIDFSCAPDSVMQAEESVAATTGLDDIALTSVSASGGTLSLTAANTATLTATTKKGRYNFWFVANRSTKPFTLLSGSLRVTAGDTN